MSGYLYNIVNILNPTKFSGFVKTNFNNLTEVFYGSFNVVKNYLYDDSSSYEINAIDPDTSETPEMTATIDTSLTTHPDIYFLTNKFVDMDDDDYDAIDILIDGDDDNASTVKTKFNGSIIKLKIYDNFDLNVGNNKTIIYNLVEHVKDLPSTSITKTTITKTTNFLSTHQSDTDGLIGIIYETFNEMAQFDVKPTAAKIIDIKKDIKNAIINFISYTNTYLGTTTTTHNDTAITNVVNELTTYYTNITNPNNGHDDDDTFVDLPFKLKGSIIDLGISAIQHEGAKDKMFYFKKLNNDTKKVLKNKRCVHLMKKLFNYKTTSSTSSSGGNVVFNRFIFGMFIKDFLINNTAQKIHRIAIEYTATPPSNINVYLVLSIATSHTNPSKSRVSTENRDIFFKTPPMEFIYGSDAIFLYNDNWNKNSNINIVNGSNNISYVSICNNFDDYQNKLTELTNQFKTTTYTELNGDASIIDRYLSICDKYHDIMTVDNKSTTLIDICSNYLNKIMTLYSNKMIGMITDANLRKFIDDIMNKYLTNNNKSSFNKFEPLMVRFVLNWYKSKIPSETIQLKMGDTSTDIGGKKLVKYLLDKDETLNPSFINSDDNLPKIADDTNHYVFNFDIMQPTSKIKSCYNNQDGSSTRKYLNSPEVIDGGHQYAFPDTTDKIKIEFPKNYKVSHFPLDSATTPTTTFDIHSFSQTKRVGGEVYYIITIYFSITNTFPPLPQYLDFSVIHYINIINAPSKNEIYDELNTTANTTQIKKMLTIIHSKLTASLTLNEENRNNIKIAILDCILHGKSTQDEQNMLQVNERSVNDNGPPTNKPTNFIGICFDFMSTANGINLRYNPGVVATTTQGVKNTGVIGYYKHNKDNNQFVGIINNKFYIINHKYNDAGDFVSKCNNYFKLVTDSASSSSVHIGGGSMMGGGTFNVKQKNNEFLTKMMYNDINKALFFNSILNKSDDPNSMEIFEQMETYINPNEDDLIYLFDLMFQNDNDNILNFTKSIGMCNNTRIKGYTIMSNHYLSVLLSCLQANGSNIVSDENQMEVESVNVTVEDVIKRVNAFFELNYVISDKILTGTIQTDKKKIINDIMNFTKTNDVSKNVTDTSQSSPIVIPYDDAIVMEEPSTKRGLETQVSIDETPLISDENPLFKKIRTGGKRFTRRLNKNNNVGKYTRRKRNGKSVKQKKTKRVNK